MTEEDPSPVDQAADAPAEPWPRFTAGEIRPGIHWLRIADDVWGVSQGAHVTILGDSREVVIVDSAFDQPAPHQFILGYLAGMGNPKVQAILLTHHHRDHSGGAARLADVTGAPIRCTSAEATLLPELTVGEPLVDGGTVRVGGLEFVPVVTPGHSPGHCCFWEPASGTMLTGDLVLGSATTSVSAPHGDMVDLLESLNRLLSFPMRLIVPAHGPLIEDPIGNVSGVLAHRAEREGQVLVALAEGHDTPEAIVTAIYTDLEPRLVKLAARQVESMLHKLARDGAVVEVEGGDRQWQLR